MTEQANTPAWRDSAEVQEVLDHIHPAAFRDAWGEAMEVAVAADRAHLAEEQVAKIEAVRASLAERRDHEQARGDGVYWSGAVAGTDAVLAVLRDAP